MPKPRTINFIPCTPAPAQGYNLKWRVTGSGDPYTDEGNFFTSPIVFEEPINPEGTCYEGTLQSNCNESGESGSLLGEEVAWSTTCEESGETGYEIYLSGGCIPGDPFSNFVITGGVAGDTVRVRVTFNGTIQKIGADFTRGNVSISSPDGTSDTNESACYTDTSPHSFSVVAFSDIVMPVSGTTSVITTGIVHNSSESSSNLYVCIISINSNPVNICATGCKGNVSTEGPC